MAREVIKVEKEPYYEGGKLKGYFTHTQYIDKPEAKPKARPATAVPPRLVTTQSLPLARPGARPQPKPQPQRPLTTEEYMDIVGQLRIQGVPPPPDTAKAIQDKKAQATQAQRPAPQTMQARTTPRPVPPMLCPGCQQRQCRCGVPTLNTAERVLARQRELGLR